MDNIVINITSSELLEKIMSGSEGVVLNIQNGVLANWSDKNLRPKIDQAIAEDLVRKLDANIKSTIREAIADEVKYEELEPVVRQTAVKVINKMIDEELDDLIQKRVKFLSEKVIKKTKL